MTQSGSPHVSSGAVRPDHPEAPPGANPLLLAVAEALAVWDALALEIGETAVVTDGHPWSRLCALVASWYGTLPVIFVTDGRDGPEGSSTLRTDDSSAAVKKLEAALGDKPGVAALDLSGRADHVDLLFEALPRFSRLMLAGPSRDTFTIDFYVNVHRRGLRLLSRVLDPDAVMRDRTAPSAEYLARAGRLLANPRLNEACHAAVGSLPQSEASA
jgi:hypothetical protein